VDTVDNTVQSDTSRAKDIASDSKKSRKAEKNNDNVDLPRSDKVQEDSKAGDGTKVYDVGRGENLISQPKDQLYFVPNKDCKTCNGLGRLNNNAACDACCSKGNLVQGTEPVRTENQGINQGGLNQGGLNQSGLNQNDLNQEALINQERLNQRNQGGLNQGELNKGELNQLNQGEFNQGRLNQGGLNQGGLNQGGLNQGGLNQGGLNQGGLNQGGFNQGGLPFTPNPQCTSCSGTGYGLEGKQLCVICPTMQGQNQNLGQINQPGLQKQNQGACQNSGTCPNKQQNQIS